jgi:hypothetical protein
MPQIVLPSNAVDYNLYEAVVAVLTGGVAGSAANTTAAVTSIIPRNCHELTFEYPLTGNPAAVVLIIKQSGSETKRVLAGDGEGFSIPSGGATNDVSLIDKFLRADINNAKVNIQMEVH